MKTSLIILALFAVSAFAAEKKSDLRQGRKEIDEKYLDERKTLSQDVHANQDKSQQLESKRVRQYQEERRVKQ